MVAKKQIVTLKKLCKSNPSSVASTLGKFRQSSKPLLKSLPNHSILNKDSVEVLNDVLGEGTFGIVRLGFFKKLNIKCAVKAGKLKQFDAKFECQILQRCQGSLYFPYCYGVFDNMMVLELIMEEGEVKTIYSAKMNNELNENAWTKVCRNLTEAVHYLHANGLLHNDIKSNNVLLKKDLLSNYYPKLIDMGKVTTRIDPYVYRLTSKQSQRYNLKYTYLAPELRNIYGSKTSSLTDIYSLGIVFEFVSGDRKDSLGYVSKLMTSETPSNRPNTLKILKLLPK